MRTSGNTTSTFEPGVEPDDGDLFTDLPSESPRPRAESIFTVIEHVKSSPLVVPPEAPRQRHRKSRREQLKEIESLAIVSLVVVYVLVLSMTIAIGFAQRGAKRATQTAEAAEADVSASPPDSEAR